MSSEKQLKQDELDALASSLELKYQVEDNLSGGRSLFSASIALTNRCDVPLKYNSESSQWKIFFCHLRMVEPSYLPADDNVDLQYAGIKIAHYNGSIFSLSPIKNFKTLQKNDAMKFKYNGQHYCASRSDILPNWYLQVEGLEPRVIQCTKGEDLDFVGEFNSPEMYKRFDYTLPTGKRRYDTYQPFSPEVRFHRYPAHPLFSDWLSSSIIPSPVVPTPKYFCEISTKKIGVQSGEWKIKLFDEDLLNEAKFLSEKLDIPVCGERLQGTGDFLPKSIVLKKIQPSTKNDLLASESYTLVVDVDNENILITASEASGAFYGVQTLLGLAEDTDANNLTQGRIPHCEISDSPRYPYRGMHVDISRNFQPKEEILLLLDVMTMYKLNKFHFHLTDDEGWRLEIPGLEELTQVGSKRGHDIEEKECLLPLLGSGPEASGLGCGFYTVEDYREILRYAKTRHIEVIPEIDMPGHSHAAVRAMRVRYDRFMAKKEEKQAKEYLLSDPRDKNHTAYSVQMLAENSMNPGLESTFTFVEKVIMEVKKMHADIQPLQVFHFGGDEVPYEAWDDSLACLELVDSGKVEEIADLMEYFVLRVAKLVNTHGLDLGAWQDGIVVKNTGPYKRHQFPNRKVLVHFWRNVWETGQAFDAFKLANEGYEVVMSPGTHLYFDHPHEPDPEERGLYWACRFVDTCKVFSFAPDNLMSNADIKLTGEHLSKTDHKMMRDSENYTELKKPDNIKGLQGQIWTELIRTRTQFHEMIFPRLIALAERAWHKASWEDEDQDKRGPSVEQDWAKFAFTLGSRELHLLEKMDVPYHIPPPGARISGDGQLELRSCYPGQPLTYSVDNGVTWLDYREPVDVSEHNEVMARVSYHNKSRHSRSVKVPVKSYTDCDGQDS